MTRTDDREALRDLIEWADDGGVDDGAITRKLDLVAALAREKLDALDAPETYDYGWRVRPGVRCVECPDCGFTFGADHTVQTDGHPAYDCPNCETAQLAPPTLPPDVRAEIDRHRMTPGERDALDTLLKWMSSTPTSRTLRALLERHKEGT